MGNTGLTREIKDKVSNHAKVQECWELLAIRLMGFDKYDLTIENIRHNRRHDTHRELMVRDVLRVWELQKPQEATLSNLIVALENIGCQALADELKSESVIGIHRPIYLTDKLLLDVAKELGTEENIRSLAIRLGIKAPKIDAAFSNNPRSVNMASHSLLKDWKNSNALRSEEDNVKTLQDALKAIGRSEIVRDVLIDVTAQEQGIESQDQVDMGTSSNNQDSSENQALERPFLEKAMKEGKDPVYRARIMLVGHSGAGKTHLLKNLIHSIYNKKEHQLTNGIETECPVAVEITTSDFNTDVPSDKEVFEKKILSISDKVREERNNIKEGSHDIPGPSEQPAREFKTDIEESVLNKTPEELRQSENTNPRKIFFWDFGGQVVFYTTHQTFLTESGIYLLIVDLSQGLNKKIETRIQTSKGGKIKAASAPRTSKEFIMFWLNSIHAAGSIKGNVIIIGTHTDHISVKKKNARIAAIKRLIMDEGALVKNHIKDYIMTINNTLASTDESFTKIRDKISEVLEGQDKTLKLYWGKERPVLWLAIGDHLKKKWKKYVTFAEVLVELKDGKGWSEEEVDEFLLYQHQLGELVYFGGKGDSLVITNPQWLINAFRAIITVEECQPEYISKLQDWARLEKEGILSDDLIKHVWVQNRLIATEEFEMDLTGVKTGLLQIMEKFDLICHLPFKNEHAAPVGGSSITNEYIVPCMLKPLSLPWYNAFFRRMQSRRGNSKPLYFHAKDHFLPDGFYYRLIARCCSDDTHSFKVSILNEKYQLFSDYAEFNNKSDSSTSITILKRNVKTKSISVRVFNSTGDPPNFKIRFFFKESIESIQRHFPNIKLVECVKYNGKLEPFEIEKEAQKLHLIDQKHKRIPIEPYLPWFEDSVESTTSESLKGENTERTEREEYEYDNGEKWRQLDREDTVKVLPMLQESYEGPTITVCVIDSGINQTHDLFKNMTTTCWESGGFTLLNNDTTGPKGGHGTACSGIIAQHVPFVKLIVMKTDLISKSSLAEPLKQLKDHQDLQDVDIISISKGREIYSRNYAMLIKDLSLKKIIICAAGNSGDCQNAICYPANLKGDVICVGSCGKLGNRSDFSSTGQNLSFLAPGEKIRAASIEGDDKYRIIDGTSFAAPYAAAVAACVLAKAKKLKYSDEEYVQFKSTRVMEAILKKMCTNPDVHTKKDGHGFLQPKTLLSDDDDFKHVLKKALKRQ